MTEPPPPGWYPDPLHNQKERYWDGEAWHHEPGASGVVPAGYLFAIVMPILGVVLGVIAGTRDDTRTRRHGPYIVVASILCGVLWWAGIARGATLTDTYSRPAPIWQKWADTSLVNLPPIPLTINYLPCPNGVDAYGCYANDQIYVSPASPPQERRRLELHEIGHWFDAHFLSDHDRDIFRQLAVAAPGPWLNGQEGVASAGEQFAEAFSLCAIHHSWRPDTMTFWRMYWKPGPRRHGRVCAFMRTVAARYVSRPG